MRNMKCESIIKGILLVFIASIWGCDKGINSGSNKANLSVIHVAPGALPVDILYNGVKINSTGQIGFTQSTGSPGNPYLPVVAGIHLFQATPDGINYYVNGNTSLQLNQYYSVFLYDTLVSGKTRALILSDYLSVPPDTMSSIRFLNLSPNNDTLNYVMTSLHDGVLDTMVLGYIPFVGPNPNPAVHSSFQSIASGAYCFGVATDTNSVIFSIRPIDSLYFSGGKIYSIYTTGSILGSGSDTLRALLHQHN